MHVHAASSSANKKMQNVLRFSLVLTLAYVVVTFIAGLRAHSLALISEAGHNVSDALALLLSFVAVYFQSRPATDAKTRRRIGRLRQCNDVACPFGLDRHRSRPSPGRP